MNQDGERHCLITYQLYSSLAGYFFSVLEFEVVSQCASFANSFLPISSSQHLGNLQ